MWIIDCYIVVCFDTQGFKEWVELNLWTSNEECAPVGERANSCMFPWKIAMGKSCKLIPFGLLRTSISTTKFVHIFRVLP